MENYKLPQRVLMINGSQLLDETFRKVIGRHKNIAVVAETKEITAVSKLILKQRPDWLLLIQPPEKKLPEEICQAVNQSEDLRMIKFATDGSKIELMNTTTSPHEVNVDDINKLVEIMLDSSSSLAEFDHQ